MEDKKTELAYLETAIITETSIELGKLNPDHDISFSEEIGCFSGGLTPAF
jgi:hypothetical protein